MQHRAQHNYSTIQYNAHQEKKSDFFYCTWTMRNGFNFFKYYFQRKKTNAIQGLESPLQPKGLGFEPFPELFFLFTNEMNESKFLR
jgi:hypothetical protein